MVIKTKGEYKKFINELSTEIRAREAFHHHFEIWLEDTLREGISVDMNILDDGQKLHVVRDFRRNDFLGMKDTHVATYDINLLEDGGIEIIEANVGLTETKDYNKRHLVKAPQESKSVFSSFFEIVLFLCIFIFLIFLLNSLFFNEFTLFPSIFSVLLFNSSS